MAFVQIHPEWLLCLHGQGFRTFDDFFHYGGGQVVGGHPTRNVTHVGLGRLHGFLKREQRFAWSDLLASWWAGFGFVSKSQREWCILHELRARGIPCPQPVAVGADAGRAFLLVRALPEAVDLYSYLLDGYCAGANERRELALALGRAAARLHLAGFSQPDLYAKHVFVNTQTRAIAFLDFQRTRFRRRVAWGRRWCDLAALDASLSEWLASPRERFLCLHAYLRAAGATPLRAVWRKALWAIARRTAHLLSRRKVRQMRSATAGDRRLEIYRVTMFADGAALAEPAAATTLEGRGRWA